MNTINKYNEYNFSTNLLINLIQFILTDTLVEENDKVKIKKIEKI